MVMYGSRLLLDDQSLPVRGSNVVADRGAVIRGVLLEKELHIKILLTCSVSAVQ